MTTCHSIFICLEITTNSFLAYSMIHTLLWKIMNFMIQQDFNFPLMLELVVVVVVPYGVATKSQIKTA